MSKILTLAATGFAGLVLGTGVGVAAAGSDSAPPPPERAGDAPSMEEMHAAMPGEVPAELTAQCNEMHAAMAEHMGDVDHESTMGSMMGGSGDLPAQHFEHHRGGEG